MKVVYIEADGNTHEVDVSEGDSVMQGALGAGIAGIEATCGGSCSCATCHVYVDPDWLARLAPPDDMEEAMLEFAEESRENSRLSCQIAMTAALDGLVVRVPEADA